MTETPRPTGPLNQKGKAMTQDQETNEFGQPLPPQARNELGQPLPPQAQNDADMTELASPEDLDQGIEAA